MANGGEVAPIIIKRKKVVVGGGHHGGAWKVAYADFVTAMMAFFMLMWLMNATTEKQRKGLADYFSPTIAISRVSGGGNGMFGGDSVFTESKLAKNGTGGGQIAPTGDKRAHGATGVRSDGADKANATKVQKALAAQLDGNSGDSNLADTMKKHIRSRVTDEGLVIELFDLPGQALFQPIQSTPTRLMKNLVSMVADVLRITNNKIAVSGYVRSFPIVIRTNPTWDLSTRRAHETRRLLVASGMSSPRIVRVTSWSDRHPVVHDPMAQRNNRIEITLLRSDRAARSK